MAFHTKALPLLVFFLVLFLTKKKNDRPPFLPLFVKLALPLELVPLALDAAVGIRE